MGRITVDKFDTGLVRVMVERENTEDFCHYFKNPFDACRTVLGFLLISDRDLTEREKKYAEDLEASVRVELDHVDGCGVRQNEGDIFHTKEKS